MRSERSWRVSLRSGCGRPGAASAHVTVNAVGATQGGYTVLTFRVPTESETASTTKLKVQLPTDHPIASVSVQPHVGWSYKVTTSKLATPITTDDGQLTRRSARSTGPLIATRRSSRGSSTSSTSAPVRCRRWTSLTFKAIQTYSDGKEVDWTDVAAPGSTAELEHPAPTLKLAAAGATAAGSSIWARAKLRQRSASSLVRSGSRTWSSRIADRAAAAPIGLDAELTRGRRPITAMPRRRRPRERVTRRAGTRPRTEDGEPVGIHPQAGGRRDASTRVVGAPGSRRRCRSGGRELRS